MGNKQITIDDLGYKQKREFVLSRFNVNYDRAEHIDNIKRIVHCYNVLTKLNTDPTEMLSDLVTTGYAAYEVVYSEKSEIIGLKKVDPITLIPKYIDGRPYWIQGHGHEQRLFTSDQIIYLKYTELFNIMLQENQNAKF